MNAVIDYLRIPPAYARHLGGLRWAASGEALETGEGRTVAFNGEIALFLEGFGARPLIHFSHIAHLIDLLRRQLPEETAYHVRASPLATLQSVFQSTGRSMRNAGAFFAMLCRELPAAPLAPRPGEIWDSISLEQLGALHFENGPGEQPPQTPEAFEAEVVAALGGYRLADLAHWLRHGTGPVGDAARRLADLLESLPPSSLPEVLAALATRERLRGAAGYVPQLTGALTLPPRRLGASPLAVGGYSDLDTRGKPEQILPGQLALDDLELLRRLAQNELLYFRREDPRSPTREELLVVLDQGVRTWGVVRLVLAAALLALGQLAHRKQRVFLVAASSGEGVPVDPLTTPPEQLAALLEASDLSPSPALALERALEERASRPRDVVLLTHPRSLAEPDVLAAARRAQPPVRLFALAADETGAAVLGELRGGAVLPLQEMRLDLARPGPRPVPVVSGSQWEGHVEPVGFPFLVGVSARQQPLLHAFDYSGRWLLTASDDGLLHATRTDGQERVVLPRALHGNRVLRAPRHLIGVAGGFVVVGDVGADVLAAHYDFERCRCTCHDLGPAPQGASVEGWHYDREHHAVLARYSGSRCLVLRLAGSAPRGAIPVLDATGSQPLDGPVGELATRYMGMAAAPPRLDLVSREAATLRPGQILFDPATGKVSLISHDGHAFSFTPEEDGMPALLNRDVTWASLHGGVLAVRLGEPGGPRGAREARLFQLPDGTPLATYLVHGLPGLILSHDGKLLARQINTARLEIRHVHRESRPAICYTPEQRPPVLPGVDLGERWLLLRYPGRCVLIRWDQGHLVATWREGRREGFLSEQLQGTGLARGGFRARATFIPGFLCHNSLRFVRGAVRCLIVALDIHGQVFLFDRTGRLVCAFYAPQGQLAGWMPGDVCFGPAALLGRAPTPGAHEQIGRALLDAWLAGEETVV